MSRVTATARRLLDLSPGMRHSREVRRSGWADADTLAAVGELTARWLTGEIPGHPSYFGEPDEETGPLAPTLAAANRAGYVTIGSQPGESGTLGYDGGTWWQRAAVEGLSTDAQAMVQLRDAATARGLDVVVGQAGRRTDHSTAIPVTASTDRVHTGFGSLLSRRELAFQFEGCHGAGVDAILDAWQVTIVDPEWGRNDVLWPLLDQFAGGAL